VVGFKPTYGRISRYGLIAFGSSLDQIGPITTNFTDCAHLLNILCGFDPADATTSQKELPDFTRFLIPGLKGVTIGMPKEYFSQGLDAEVEQSLKAAAKVFRELGAKIVEVSLPHTEYAVATYYIIAPSEASSNLQRFDGIKYGMRKGGKTLMELYKKTRAAGFGDEAKRRILIGTHSLSSGYYEAYYLRALKVRTLIRDDFNKAFKKADVLLTPTSPTPAFKIGEKSDDPLKMYLSDVYTISANLAGTCAVSFPCGFTKDKLPIGAQLIGKNFDEGALIRAGYAFEEATGFHKQIPPLAGDA
jgi:aspartyl-tRNA(Asn)/glutamyl-tRNA(Gln) amidotransferase subunit A